MNDKTSSDTANDTVDFNSTDETTYLLSSENNTKRLTESIAQLKAGKSKHRELIRREHVNSKDTL